MATTLNDANLKMPDRPDQRANRPRGRRDAEKQEKVIKTDILKDKVDDLVGLYKAQQESANDFSERVKKVAETSGLLAASVRRFVVARAGENFEEAKTKALQLSLLFEEIGE
jgi:hypothetical protein